jgi:hypothetical protein
VLFCRSLFLRDVSAFSSSAGDALRASGIPVVLDAAEQLSGERVILAPLDVSNLVPVLTHHYSLFTQYAHFESVSDKELAERYLLQQAFFSLLPEHTIEGHPLVFGIGAGNLYARTKTFCRIKKALYLTKDSCLFTLSDFIFHQDVRSFVEVGKIDTLSMLRKYGVDTIITDKDLPEQVQPFCHELILSAPYTLYDCDFDR